MWFVKQLITKLSPTYSEERFAIKKSLLPGKAKFSSN